MQKCKYLWVLIALSLTIMTSHHRVCAGQNIQKTSAPGKAAESGAMKDRSGQKKDHEIEAFLKKVLQAKSMDDVDKAFEEARFSAAQKKKVGEILKKPPYSKKLAVLAKIKKPKMQSRVVDGNASESLDHTNKAPGGALKNYDMKKKVEAATRLKGMRKNDYYRNKLLLDNALHKLRRIRMKALTKVGEIKSTAKIVRRLVDTCVAAGQKNRAAVVLKAFQGMGLNVTDVSEKPDGSYVVRISKKMPVEKKAMKAAPSSTAELRVIPKGHGIYIEDNYLRVSEIIRKFNPSYNGSPDMGDSLSEMLCELAESAMNLGGDASGIAMFPRNYRCIERLECSCYVEMAGEAVKRSDRHYVEILHSMLNIEATHKEVTNHCEGRFPVESCRLATLDREGIKESLEKNIKGAEYWGDFIDEIYDVINLNYQDFIERCGSVP